MILFRKPAPLAIQAYLAAQSNTAFSYLQVGATLGELPTGYVINCSRKCLGWGDQVFQQGCEALQSFEQLRMGWVDCWPIDADLKAGEDIAVLGQALGLWWINACRIVYVMDERDTQRRFSYAHGTLPDHLASGEEKFSIEMRADASVWIEIISFSRPNTRLAKLGSAYMRRAQRRFGRASVDHISRLLQPRVSNLVATVGSWKSLSSTK